MTTKQLTIELALLGLLALLWGSSFMLISISVQTIPPVTVSAIRVTVASLMICMVMFSRGQRFPRDPNILKQLFILACIGNIGPWVLIAWGQQHIDSALAAVLNSTSPIWVLFITLFLLKGANPPAFKILGAGLGLIGVILIVGTNTLQELGSHLLGQIAVLVSAILYGFTAIYGRRFYDLPNTVTAASTCTLAACFLVPLSFIVDQPLSLTPSLTSVIAVILLSIFSTGIALMLSYCQIWCLRIVGHAAIWFSELVSIPSLNLMPVMTLARRPLHNSGFHLGQDFGIPEQSNSGCLDGPVFT